MGGTGGSQTPWQALDGVLIHLFIITGGCGIMIQLLSSPQADAQHAAIFAISSLIREDQQGVQRCFARHQGG